MKAEEYPVNLYAWDSSNNYINGAWPGSQMTDKKTIGGVEWYYKSFDKATYPTVNFQLNKGGNTTQTGDITGITSDYYCTYNSGSKSASDVTATYQYVPEDDLYQAGELTAFFEAPFLVNGQLLGMEMALQISQVVHGRVFPARKWE